MGRSRAQRRSARSQGKDPGTAFGSNGEPVAQPAPVADPAEKAAREKACDNEFARYNKERDSLIKTELDAEKNYDTLLVTLSTGVIGASYVLLKDAGKMPPSTYEFLIASWVSLSLCLFGALVDRLLTYISHQKLRGAMDNQFSGWSGPGAMERAITDYNKLRWPNVLPIMKWVCFGTFFCGVGLLVPALLWNFHNGSNQPQQPIVVYVNQAPPQPAVVRGAATHPVVAKETPMKGDTMPSKNQPQITPPVTPPMPATRPAPIIDTRPAPTIDIGAGKPIPPAAPRPVDVSPKPNK
jgi:hypothetical protein